MDKTTHLSEASLSTIDVDALGPAPDVDYWLSDWQEWLDLRVRAGEISAAAKTAYSRGAEKYFSFANGRDPANLGTVKEWKDDLLEQYDPQTVNTWLAGVKSFINWRAETQRFL